MPWPARRLLQSLLLLLALSPTAGQAGGFTIPDFGGRRVGMMAVVAYPDDVTAIFHNPAGLVLQDGTTFQFYAAAAFSELALRLYDSEGSLHPDHEISPDISMGAIPFLGAATDLGTDRFRLALGVYAPNAFGAALPEDEPTRYHATKVLFVGSRATLSAAYRFSPEFSIGAGVSLVHVYLMANRFLNLSVLADPDQRFLPPEETAAGDGRLDLDGQGFSYAWDFGLLFEPTSTLRIGGSFASGSSPTLRGDVRLKQPDGSTEHATQSTPMSIPFTLRAGMNWAFAPDFEVGADVRYWHYQVYQELRSTLSDPIAGMDEFVDPKNYGNSWNWCIGMLYRILPGVELMTGYQQDFTPIPKQTFTLDNPSRDQRGITGGVRWQVVPNHRIGLYGLHNWINAVDVQESVSIPPSNTKGHGSTSEIGFEYIWQAL